MVRQYFAEGGGVAFNGHVISYYFKTDAVVKMSVFNQLSTASAFTTVLVKKAK